MYHQRRMQQLGGDRHSDSLYFTPSGTPIREIPDVSLSGGKSTSFSNDSAAYSAVYAATGTGNHSKKHQRVKSFSHFLPGWFNNTKEVQVEVVVEQNKDDYYDVNSDKKLDSPEEGSYLVLIWKLALKSVFSDFYGQFCLSLTI